MSLFEHYSREQPAGAGKLKRKGFENIRMADKTKEFTTHRPTKGPAGSRAPNPDEYRKAHLQKAKDLSKKVVTTAAVKK
jgi:hypothetical protein